MSIVAGPNPFALALIYYFDYRRNKLQPELLLKIAKKYKSCPEKLLVDLQNKYNHPISNITPTIQHILRIFSVTAIPNEYLLLLPSEWKCNSEQYIAQCDPLRDTFDASIVLSQKCLHIGSNSTKLFDNLSKIKHLISSLKVPLSSSIVNLTSTITKLPTEQTITETTVTMNSTTISTTNAPKYTHVIHRIAQSTVETAPSLTVGNTGSCSGSSSSKRKRSHGERIAKDKFTTVDLEASDVDSPFQLIYNIMTEKRRACILIRRHPKYVRISL